jgi:hypothetical protein
MSPELKTLDELLCEDLDLAVIRGLFDEEGRFVRALTMMLHAGEIRLVVDGGEAPHWRWAELLAAADESAGGARVQVAITDAGAERIGG